MAINSISDEHRRDDLVPGAGKRNPNYRRDIPVQVWRLSCTHQEDDHPDDRKPEAGVAEPQSELRRWCTSNLLRAAVHPGV